MFNVAQVFQVSHYILLYTFHDCGTCVFVCLCVCVTTCNLFLQFPLGPRPITTLRIYFCLPFTPLFTQPMHMNG